MISAALQETRAFKNVSVNGTVLTDSGEKMSKSKRNFTDPNIVLKEFGADALRIYLIDSPVVNAKDLRFADAGVQEKVRTVLLPLWNSYSFLTRYAELDGWQPDGVDPDPAMNELDGWVLARLQSLVGLVREHMEEYKLFLVVPALVEFIDDLTNWYIRLSRRRFWRGASEGDGDKVNAYRTLHHVLLTLSEVLAPFLPFISDEMYENLSAGKGLDSVHLEDYPQKVAAFEDVDLERRMELARLAVSLGRSLRVAQNVRIRQPLASLTLAVGTPEDRKALDGAKHWILSELNIREVLWAEQEADLVSFSARPNLKVLGPKYGKQLGAIRKEIGSMESSDCARIAAGESIASQAVEGLTYDQETLLVDRNSREGVVVGTEGGVTVALDVNLTPELEREGLAREFISRVQNMRKESGLALDDRIRIGVSADGEAAQALQDHWTLISAEVLADQEGPSPVPSGAQGEAVDLLGHSMALVIEKR